MVEPAMAADLLLQMPDAFMRAQAKETLGTDLGDHYAVGMLFSQSGSRAADAGA